MDRIYNLLSAQSSALQILLLVFLMYMTVIIIQYLFRQSRPATVEKIAEDSDKQRAEVESRIQEITGTKFSIWKASYFQQRKYLDINVEQNINIYRVTIRFIAFGFVLICVGIILGLLDISHASPDISLTAIIAGLLTQFIAGTILIAFKLIFLQTREYFRAVERMTHIGVAMNILDELPSGNPGKDLKRRTQAKIAIMIIAGQYGATPANNDFAETEPEAKDS